MRQFFVVAPVVALFCVFVACGQDGAQGVAGPPGAAGQPGENGAIGQGGASGEGGANGSNGEGGANEGGTSTAPVDPTSGSRIKTRFTTTTTVGTDGATQTTKYFAGWFDSQRNEPCSVAPASDGKNRCLPAGTAAFGGGAYMADAACTKPIVAVVPYTATCGTPPFTVPKYVTAPVTVSGCSGTKLSAVGAKLALATWYVKSGVNCLSAGAPPAAYDIYDASGAEIPATDFVEFTVTTQTL